MPVFNFTGISGHTAFSTTVCPILFRLALYRRPSLLQISGFYLGLLFGYLIGISRLFVKAHSMSEVVPGCFLGTLVSFISLESLEKAGQIAMNRTLQTVISIFLCGFLLLSPAPT